MQILCYMNYFFIHFYWVLNNLIESFTVATMTWLTTMEYLCHKLPRICYTCRKHFSVLNSFMTYYRVCNQINTMGATSGTGTAYLSGAPEFTPGFQWGSCYSIFSYPLANEVAKGYSNATVRPSHPCEHSRINILQWILTKLGTYIVLKRIWNPIDFQGQRSRSPDQIFTA